MNQQQAGVVLMILPQLWLAYRMLKAINGKFTVNVIALCLAIACFVVGRIAAGQGLYSLLVS